MPGFDTKRFIGLDEWLAKELECSICLQVFDRAVDTQCGHTFCMDCIQKTIVNNRLVCPQCRHECQRKRPRSSTTDPIDINGSIYKANRRVDSIINKLKTNCDFEAKGCEEVLEMGSLSAHLEKCLYNLCEKCGLKVGKRLEHDCIQLLKIERKRFTNSIIGYKFKLKQSDIRFKELQHKYCELEEEVKRLKTEPDTESKPVARGAKGVKRAAQQNKSVNIVDAMGVKVDKYRMRFDTTFDELMKYIGTTFDVDNQHLKVSYKCDQPVDRGDTLATLNIASRKTLNAYFDPQLMTVNIDCN